jgi:outer membrane protein assembly factor BamB/signal transduction histidine kinase
MVCFFFRMDLGKSIKWIEKGGCLLYLSINEVFAFFLVISSQCRFKSSERFFQPICISYFCAMRSLFLLILFFYVGRTAAQVDPVYWNLTSKDGLSSNTIYSFHEYMPGQMLASSNGGVDVFWGKNFQALLSDGAPHSRALINFVEDGESRLFCNDFEGRTYKIKNYKIELLDTSLWKSKFVKHGSLIYHISKDRVSLFDSDLQKLKKTVCQLNQDDDIYSAQSFKNYLFLFVINHGNLSARIEVLDTETGQVFQRFDLNHYAQIDFHMNQGRLLVADNSKSVIYELAENDGEFRFSQKRIQLPRGQRINHAYIFNDGKIGVASHDGFRIYSADFNLIKHFFQHQSITKIAQDAESNLWLGTRMEGIYIIPSLELVELNTPDVFGKYTNVSNAIFAEGKLVVGTSDGKLRALQRSGKIEWELDFENNIEVQAMHILKEGVLLVYCHQLLEIDLHSGKILKKHKVTSTKVIRERKGLIACGTSRGIALSKDNFLHHHTDLWIRGMEFLNDSTLLLESQFGLKQLDVNSLKLHDFMPAELSAPKNLVAWKNKLLVREEGGIIELTDGKLTATPWNFGNNVERMGELSNFLYLIFSDGKVVLFNEEKTIWLDRYSGLFNHSSKKILDGGQHWISIADRNIRWISKKYQPNRMPPKLRIQQWNGSFKNQGEYYESEYASNYMTVGFHVLPNAASLGESKVFYRIKGIVDEWVELDRFEDAWKLSMERLPYGAFVLEVFAQNAFGDASEIIRFPLKISVPFYLSWPFLIGVMLVLLFFIFLFVRWRVAINKKKGVELLEREKLKLKAINAELAAIRSQMNPHFIFNSLSSIQTKILSNQTREAYDHLSMFAKLMRSALDFSKTEFITLQEELDFIQNYVAMEQRRSDRPFEFQLHVNDSIDLKNITFPSLILQPFVENAIVHGFLHATGEKKLTIDVMLQEVGIRIEITDNGVGRRMSRVYNQQKPEKHKSFATLAVQERLEMLREKGVMNVQINTTDLDPGTKVEIWMHTKLK